MLTKQGLIEFELEIKDLFLAGKIHAPIHLSAGNEDVLIEIFKSVKPDDWVFSTHRSHFHALLKGIPPDWLKAEILAGRSMHINSKEYNFVTSSIVAGCCPIALGVAMAIKRQGESNYVWCFVGDMAATTGIFHECLIYSDRQDLPIKWVIEDNGLATNTPTQKAWGDTSTRGNKTITYKYERNPEYGHINVPGKWVDFK